MIEYRIKPVTRFIVTRYEQPFTTTACSSGQVEERGEFNNADTAYAVAYALCKLEHDRSGEPINSMNFIYPEHPEALNRVVDSSSAIGYTHEEWLSVENERK